MLSLRRAPSLFLLARYGVEFLAEFIYGLQGAVLPHIRDELGLSLTAIPRARSKRWRAGLYSDKSA